MWPFNSKIVAQAYNHTPDEFLLEQSEYLLLFDCGPFLHYDYVTPAYTVQKMNMWKQNSRFFGKSALLFQKKLPKARCAGHLYLLNKKQMMQLDIERKNGLHFHRKRIPVYTELLDQNGHRQILADGAWSYIGEPEHWDKEMKFDLDCFKGKGEYSLAPIFPHNSREFNNHFRFDYTPPARLFPHVRPSAMSKEVQQVDEFERSYEDNNKKPYVEPASQYRRVIHLNGTYEPNDDEQDNGAARSLSKVS